MGGVGTFETVFLIFNIRMIKTEMEKEKKKKAEDGSVYPAKENVVVVTSQGIRLHTASNY